MRGEVEAISRAGKERADMAWKQVSGNYGYEGLTFEEALDAVDASNEENKEVYKANMREKYLYLSKNYDKYLKDLVD